jgi:hypothetical protein
MTLTATVLLLAACGGGGSAPQSPPRVASLQSPGETVASASATADPDSQRPQLRVDSSEEERLRLNNAWTSCLKNEGVPTYQKAAWLFPGKGEDEFPAAFKTCHLKQPRIPARQDPARNPHYAEDNRNWIKCINKKSPVIKIRGTEDGWTFVRDYGSDPAQQDAFDRTVRDCELQAFGRG